MTEQIQGFPQRFRRLISGSHLVFATLVLGAAVAWAVGALNGSLEDPLFNLAFAFWILARVPLFHRESLLMAKRQAQALWMTRTDFVILAVGHTCTGILFGLSAWIERNPLAVVLSIALLLWATLNWFAVISKQQPNGRANQS